jgi:signal recognition particle subunit SEC65
MRLSKEATMKYRLNVRGLLFVVELGVDDVRDFQKLVVFIESIEVYYNSRLRNRGSRVPKTMDIPTFEKLRRTAEDLGYEYFEAEYEARQDYLNKLQEEAAVENWKRFPPIEERARMAGRPVWKQERIERREKERQAKA